jgi:hypothetical protein
VGRLNESTLRWARDAIRFAGGQRYNGKTSGHWYTSRDFFELCDSAKGMTVRKLLTDHFEGCGDSAITSGFKGKQASDISLDEAKTLLARIRDASDPVKHNRLGKCNTSDLEEYLGPYYVKIEGTYKSEINSEVALIPYVVEAWASLLEGDDSDKIRILVNRTTITGEVAATHSKTNLNLSGCNLSDEGYVYPIDVGQRPVKVTLSIITPYMPKTTEGKNPDLRPFRDTIDKAITKAVNRAKKDARKAKQDDKPIILAHLKEGMEKAGGGKVIGYFENYVGGIRFPLRNVFYVIRPHLLPIKEPGDEPEYGTFADVIGDFENELGHDLPGVYRDPRGTFHDPHENKTIPVGTLTVEKYIPPDWSFNKVLYIEKEGYFPILQGTEWAKKHDCALLTSKGQTTRAVKDLLDSLEGRKEEITFFCVHDADAYGTSIYQALQNETRARKARKVEIINLGLEPWEGIEMNLAVETIGPLKKGRRRPVADYVSDEHPQYDEWLQTHRIELNAMTMPQFIDWLSKKMEPYDQGKLIPPEGVLTKELQEKVHKTLEDDIRDKILEEQDFKGQVERAYKKLTPKMNKKAKELHNNVADDFKKDPAHSWHDPILEVARNLVVK